MRKTVTIKHLWVEMKPGLKAESFVDELEILCQKYAGANPRVDPYPHFSFTFQEEQ